MKKLLIFAIILITHSLVMGEELYYYGRGEKIYLYPYKDMISVKWRNDIKSNEKERILNAIPNIKSYYNIERFQLTILRTDAAKAQTILEKLFSLPEIDFGHSLLHIGENDTLILTNELVVKLKPPLTVENLEEKYEVELLWEDPFDDACKVLVVLKHSQYNALEIANMLTEKGVVKYACPNFIYTIELQAIPNDYFYPNQWALPKIDAPLAWDYETGSSNIIVAVFDDGIDLDHPDLTSIIVTGYDAIDEDYVPQCDPEDGHGTSCAGIIAAVTNNNEEGIAGVAGGWGSAGGVRIMPIRVIVPGIPVSAAIIKYCLEWAVDNGADILSNSWSQPAWNDIIHDGIEYAVNHNCLVFASAGNYGDDVRYPASDPLCIAVGATDQDDQQWYYSCHGDALDITAPSGDKDLMGDIWTTDNTGDDGYYPDLCDEGSPDGDYMGNFGGTSAACPYAVGVAALIWSKYPDHPAYTIRAILEKDSEDLGAIGWDQDYGWGRVNALAPLVCCQPDNQIKSWWETYYMGGDIYNSTGIGQQVLQFADPNQWAKYHIFIENDSDMGDIINVRATESGTGTWTTRYYDALSGGNNITEYIKSSQGWRTGMLQPGEYREIRVEVRPGYGMNGLIKRVYITSRAQNIVAESLDVVYMDTQCNILQPDNQIKNSNESIYIGNNIYNTTGEGQTKNQNTPRGRKAVYHIKIENDGETWDIDWINGPGSDEYWTIEYFDAITGGNNITDGVVNGTYFVILTNPGDFEYLRVEVTPSSSCPWETQKEVLVTSTAGYNANKRDAVKAVTKNTLRKIDPLKSKSKIYCFDMGGEVPVPILVHRQGYLKLGPEEHKTVDYDSTELVYHLVLNTSGKRHKIKWTYYHEEPHKLKLQFTVDDILFYNSLVKPSELVNEEVWLPDATLDDNEITIRVKKILGSIAVLSVLEIYTDEDGDDSSLQGDGNQFTEPFFVENLYPNPSRGTLKIKFHSPDERKVVVKMYDVTGRLVRLAFHGKANIGMNEIIIRPENLAAGVYFVNLEADDYTKVERAIFLR